MLPVENNTIEMTDIGALPAEHAQRFFSKNKVSEVEEKKNESKVESSHRKKI